VLLKQNANDFVFLVGKGLKVGSGSGKSFYHKKEHFKYRGIFGKSGGIRE
jgi:hypothetical protein